MNYPFLNRITPAELERLAILDEEMHEAGQIIGKILRHGYNSYDLTSDARTTNRWMLEKELGDMMWAIRMMCAACDINADRIEQAAKEKGPRAQQYLHHQPVPVKHEDRCLCGGVGCNSCEPQGRG